MAIADEFTHNELTEMFDYLDTVRRAGFVNIYGATGCLVHHFQLDEDIARDVLTEWMRSFDTKVRPADRVEQLMQVR